MHITLETDYAVRIVDCLARNSERMSANTISDKVGVTLRFSLKILRKLVAAGIARSFKGSRGGYELAKPLDQISLNDVLESIEGPYTFSRCLRDGKPCTWRGNEKCPYHYLFRHLSDQMQVQLQSVTIASIVQGDDD